MPPGDNQKVSTTTVKSAGKIPRLIRLGNNAQYRVTEFLGRGGYAVVVKARRVDDRPDDEEYRTLERRLVSELDAMNVLVKVVATGSFAEAAAHVASSRTSPSMLSSRGRSRRSTSPSV